jgi:hypothetical protein
MPIVREKFKNRVKRELAAMEIQLRDIQESAVEKLRS